MSLQIEGFLIQVPASSHICCLTWICALAQTVIELFLWSRPSLWDPELLLSPYFCSIRKLKNLLLSLLRVLAQGMPYWDLQCCLSSTMLPMQPIGSLLGKNCSTTSSWPFCAATSFRWGQESGCERKIISCSFQQLLCSPWWIQCLSAECHRLYSYRPSSPGDS